MRRVGRWMLDTVTLLSLLLLVATAALTRPGRAAVDAFVVQNSGRFWAVEFTVGRVEWWNGPLPPPARRFPLLSSSVSPGDDAPAVRAATEPPPPKPAGWVLHHRAWPLANRPALPVEHRWWTPGFGSYGVFLANRPSNIYGSAEVTVLPRMPTVAMTAALPLTRIVGPLWRRARRGKIAGRLGSCPCCSYDLTANVSGVCPECGTAIAKGVA